jgi:hypothetical protein
MAPQNHKVTVSVEDSSVVTSSLNNSEINIRRPNEEPLEVARWVFNDHDAILHDLNVVIDLLAPLRKSSIHYIQDQLSPQPALKSLHEDAMGPVCAWAKEIQAVTWCYGIEDEAGITSSRVISKQEERREKAEHVMAYRKYEAGQDQLMLGEGVKRAWEQKRLEERLMWEREMEEAAANRDDSRSTSTRNVLRRLRSKFAMRET